MWRGSIDIPKTEGVTDTHGVILEGQNPFFISQNEEDICVRAGKKYVQLRMNLNISMRGKIKEDPKSSVHKPYGSRGENP